MPQEPVLSPVHRIVEIYSRAVAELGLTVPLIWVERWAVAVHQALSSRSREFHTHQHVLDLVKDADPIEAIAALYHDIVYVQVDLDVPVHYAELLRPLIVRDPGTEQGWGLLPECGIDPTAKAVLALFGFVPGQVLTPYSGLNELASALVAAKELEGVLTRNQLLALVACIEASIPFRDGEAVALRERLAALGVPSEEIGSMLRRATRLSNNDVGNFADPDPARFLDQTWKLLPETTPSLHTPTISSIGDYRVALMKMEDFLSKLPAERVFHTWSGEPSVEEHQRRISRAAYNIQLAVRYMRCKLYSTAMVEALALESGGDVPLPYFVGGTPEVPGAPMKRLEQFLPALKGVSGEVLDPMLREMLQGGRSTTSSFDLAPSPVAEYLCVALGEPRLLKGLEDARSMWDGRLSAREFLSRQPRAEMRAVGEAAAEMTPTRAAVLRELIRAL